MKLLFLMRHSGYVRNFESTLRLLCERGHSVHLAFQGKVKYAQLDPTAQDFFNHEFDVKKGQFENTKKEVVRRLYGRAFPAYFGTEPWIGSKTAPFSPTFIPGAIPSPPTIPAVRSERMSP